MHNRDRLLMGLALVGLVGLIGADLSGRLEVNKAAVYIYVLTGLVVLWSTIETRRIRIDAEAKSETDRQPVLLCNVELPGQRLPTSSVMTLEVAKKWIPNPRFILRNASANAGLVLVRVELQTSEGTATFDLPEHTYSGRMAWHVTAYFEINGHFSIGDLLAAAQRETKAWPTVPQLRLGVFLHCYSLERVLLYSQLREFVVDIDPGRGSVAIWPEVTPRTFTLATEDPPRILPEDRVTGFSRPHTPPA